MEKNDQTSEEDAALKARLARLKSAIGQETASFEAEKKSAEGGGDSDHGTGRAMGVGMKVASELVANVLVGGLIGYYFDKWLGTEPAFLLIFLLLGVASGFWNVYRIAMRPTGPQKPAEDK